MERKKEREDAFTKKIVFITLIIIIFVSILGTFTILSYIEEQSTHARNTATTTGAVTLDILPPSAEHIQTGELIENDNS